VALGVPVQQPGVKEDKMAANKELVLKTSDGRTYKPPVYKPFTLNGKKISITIDRVEKGNKGGQFAVYAVKIDGKKVKETNGAPALTQVLNLLS
jgi:hypothetical protein